MSMHDTPLECSMTTLIGNKSFASGCNFYRHKWCHTKEPTQLSWVFALSSSFSCSFSPSPPRLPNSVTAAFVFSSSTGERRGWRRGRVVCNGGEGELCVIEGGRKGRGRGVCNGREERVGGGNGGWRMGRGVCNWGWRIGRESCL